MKFHAILCTRDEDDIVSQSLQSLLTWAHNVFVFDNGSVDQTWQLVLELARNEPRIKLVSNTPVWFADQLRGYVFDLVRHHFQDGDWVLRIDTDEVYHVSPPEFVERYMRAGESVAYHQYYDFKLTVSDVQKLDSYEAICEERKLPIASRRTSYVPSVYSEPRMFKYRTGMTWPANYTFPRHAGLVARERIPIRHYPNRDPLQMAKRVLLRKTMIAAKENQALYGQSHHWREQDWMSFVVSDSDSTLKRWREGETLDSPSYLYYATKPHIRAVQDVYYRSGLVRVVDWLKRSKRSDVFQPRPIPDRIQDQMQESLQKFFAAYV